ncbi:class A beta-lactamase [Amycolatopsis sp. H20-H5]|uniref:class A beta-lactamase n=1 Tax=Amycolatopsis sp. H20-H5 TaxID=3046309 RepID=UPI002DBFEFD8|nr:class A beta-lactamase [Amycolatopsis sp. H20-H5]MEC3981300.1 class A beta-lactamase [Amycolatopsis sp. H20-H5]
MPQRDRRFGDGLPRRGVLLGGLGALLAGCTPNAAPEAVRLSGTPSPLPGVAAAEAALASVEAGFGGRLGVFGLDTGSGATVRYRADERFLLCSTHKAIAVAAVLRLRDRQPGLMDRLIRYDRSQLLSYAPVTTQHVDEGMTVSALCEAALTVSDNTASNLLVELVGGPPAATAFVRTLGDQVSRFDRLEPELNVGAPGDERDTSTPAQLAADLRALVLGDALDKAGRDLLTGWLKANTTGGKQIRAGLPAGWLVGDKTGSGSQGEVNDIAVVWPPGRAPLVISVYTAPADPKSTAGQATVAKAAMTVAKALVPTE